MSNKAIAGIIVALALIGGIAYFATKNSTSSPTATSTPTTVSETPTRTPVTPTPTPTPRQAGTPAVFTDSTVAPTETTAIVSGTVTPNGAFTTYWYEYGLSTALGSKTSNQGLGSGFTALKTPAYITGLVKSTTYYFRLVAENKYGRVPGATYSFATTAGTPPPVGSAPRVSTSAATGISRTTANLGGSVTPNRAPTEYWFEYGKTAELGNTSALVSAGDGTNAVAASLSLSDLDPATTYYFRLSAHNEFGTVNGSILNFKTAGPPGIPSAPTVTTRSANGVATSTATLRGTVNPNGADTTYWFEYSTDSLLSLVLVSKTPDVSAGGGTENLSVDAALSGLSRNTTYYFRIVAQNSQGVSRGERLSFKTK